MVNLGETRYEKKEEVGITSNGLLLNKLKQNVGLYLDNKVCRAYVNFLSLRCLKFSTYYSGFLYLYLQPNKSQQ